jgi:dephospho-CoA kinase
MIIGLAGKSCSGKNQVAEILKQKGFHCIDMDLMAHDLLEAMKLTLSSAFGPSILDFEGRVDRKKLGNIVFSDSLLLKKLEDLLYPELHNELTRYLKEVEPGIPTVLNAAALQKGEFWRRCDIVIWVKAPLFLRLFRAYKRDKRSLLHLIKRFRAQKQLKSQYFLSRVDTYIIRNGLTRSVLQNEVETWIKHLPPER